MQHCCGVSTGKDCPGLKRCGESPDVVLQPQLTGADIDGVGPVYWEGFLIFTKLSQGLLLSEQLPTLLLSPSVRIEIVLLVKKKKKIINSNEIHCCWWLERKVRVNFQHQFCFLAGNHFYSHCEQFQWRKKMKMQEIGKVKGIPRTLLHWMCLMGSTLKIMSVAQFSWYLYFL